MTYQDFIASLQKDKAPDDLSPLLLSLWFSAKGNWEQAHDIADRISGADGDWIHAYLHREEGDQWNADYWYRRAGRTRPQISLQEEWTAITKDLLARM